MSLFPSSTCDFAHASKLLGININVVGYFNTKGPTLPCFCGSESAGGKIGHKKHVFVEGLQKGSLSNVCLACINNLFNVGSLSEKLKPATKAFLLSTRRRFCQV